MKRRIIFLVVAFVGLCAQAIYIVSNPSTLNENQVIVDRLVYERIDDSSAKVRAIYNDCSGEFEQQRQETGWTYEIQPKVKIGNDSLTVVSIGTQAIGMATFEPFVWPLNVIIPPTVETIEPMGLNHLFWVDTLTINSIIPPLAYNEGVGIKEMLPADHWVCRCDLQIMQLKIPEGATEYYQSAPGSRKNLPQDGHNENSELQCGVLSKMVFDCDGWVVCIFQESDNEVELCFRVLDENEFELDIPAELSHNGQTYSVVSIGREAFTYTHYTSVHVPPSVRSIHADAFTESRIQELTGLEGVGSMSLSNLRRAPLRILELGNIITRIGSGAFKYTQTDKLYESLKFPDYLEIVDASAFVRVILQKAICRNTKVPEALDESFVDCKLGTLIVPDESVEDYRTAPGWRLFSQIVGQSHAGIDYVEADGCEGDFTGVEPGVRYYNLHGVELSSPTEGGIYIERRDNNRPRKVVR